MGNNNRNSLGYLRKLRTRFVEALAEQKNDIRLIESLRAIAECVAYGEAADDPQFFELFSELGLLKQFISIANSSEYNILVRTQVIQSMGLLVHNIRCTTSLYLLLSNNHVNSLIESAVPSPVLNVDNEAYLNHYASFLKTISLRLNPTTVQFFLDPISGSFPLFWRSLPLFSSNDAILRTCGLNIMLHIFSIDDDGVRRFCADSEKFSVFLNLLITLLSSRYTSLHAQVLSSDDNFDRVYSEAGSMLDLFFYIEDIVSLSNVSHMKFALMEAVLNKFIYKILDEDFYQVCETVDSSLQSMLMEKSLILAPESEVKARLALFVLLSFIKIIPDPELIRATARELFIGSKNDFRRALMCCILSGHELLRLNAISVLRAIATSKCIDRSFLDELQLSIPRNVSSNSILHENSNGKENLSQSGSFEVIEVLLSVLSNHPGKNISTVISTWMAMIELGWFAQAHEECIPVPCDFKSLCKRTFVASATALMNRIECCSGIEVLEAFEQALTSISLHGTPSLQGLKLDDYARAEYLLSSPRIATENDERVLFSNDLFCVVSTFLIARYLGTALSYGAHNDKLMTLDDAVSQIYRGEIGTAKIIRVGDIISIADYHCVKCYIYSTFGCISQGPKMLTWAAFGHPCQFLLVDEKGMVLVTLSTNKIGAKHLGGIKNAVEITIDMARQLETESNKVYSFLMSASDAVSTTYEKRKQECVDLNRTHSVRSKIELTSLALTEKSMTHLVGSLKAVPGLNSVVIVLEHEENCEEFMSSIEALRIQSETKRLHALRQLAHKAMESIDESSGHMDGKINS